MRQLTGILVLSLAIASCSKRAPESGIDESMTDKSVAPQADFYEYMNGHWLKTFEIPADKSRYDSFSRLADDAEKNLRGIIENAAYAGGKTPGSDAQKVGDTYLSFMDSTRIEQLDLSPIRKELDDISSITERTDLVKLAARYTKAGEDNTFSLFVDQDPKISTQYILYLYQSGLSLPDRDYYLRADPKFTDIRSKFQAHMERMFELAGIPDGAKRAQTVMSIEMAIAKSHWDNVENRDRTKTYNKFAFAALQRLTPAIDWKLFAAEASMRAPDSVLVFQPSYFKALSALMSSTPLDDWKTYYTWHVLSGSAPYLSKKYADENFNFFERTIRGTPDERPRWKRAVSAVNDAMGELVGKLYVAKYFKPEAKERMVRLVANLKDAFRERIKSLSWMSDETKQKALEKLSKFGTKIGYPDKWKDYSALAINADDLIGNLRRAAIVEFDRQISRLGKPIDRTLWLMTPQIVNAYYNPNMNEIVFPAAILQPPFFNVNADDAVNYGAIGAAIGHEMTHGFDDQGRKSDGDGNLTDWWTLKDAKEFDARAQVMVNEYNQFNPIDTLRVNGRLTLGENIADLGGLTIAYYAYKKSLEGKEAPVIDGYSGDQRFFLGWAQIWAFKARDNELRRLLITNPHSPGRYRVIGVVSNMPEFYAAFNVQEGDAMYKAPDQRVQIW